MKSKFKISSAPARGASIFGIFGSIKKLAKSTRDPQVIAGKLATALKLSPADAQMLSNMVGQRMQQATVTTKKG